MKRDNLLLLESMFLPERRHLLPRLIEASTKNNAELATEIFWGQVVYVNALLQKMYGVDCALDIDVVEFMELITRSKRTLLGKIRLSEVREIRKKLKDGENEQISECSEVSGGQD